MPPSPGRSRYRVYIKADGNANGYPVAGAADTSGSPFDADYMIQNGTLFRSTGIGWSWRKVAAVRQSRTGDTYRWHVPLARVRPSAHLEIVFNGVGDRDVDSDAVPVGDC